MQDQHAALIWKDKSVPVSERFDDPYYSLQDGLEESRYVFLAGNDLPDRFEDGFRIAELGFGTGLNLLAAAEAWRNAGAPGRLTFTSFEAFPMRRNEMARALDAFPAVADLANALCAAWTGETADFDLTPGISVSVVIGDARTAVPQWRGQADAWFLDGFAPSRNPELWEPELIRAVAEHTAANGTLATYTAAGSVRRALADAGFSVARVAGFGRKRHMTRARLA